MPKQFKKNAHWIFTIVLEMPNKGKEIYWIKTQDEKKVKLTKVILTKTSSNAEAKAIKTIISLILKTTQLDNGMYI